MKGLFAVLSPHTERRLRRSFRQVCRSLDDLRALLNVKSYAKMGQPRHLKRLRALEKRLGARMTHPIGVRLIRRVPRELLNAFLSAFLLADLYHDTVGSSSETLATLKLITFPMFSVTRFNHRSHAQAFRRLCTRFAVHHEDVKRVLAEHKRAQENIRQTAQLVTILKSHLEMDASLHPTRASAYRLFRLFFPDAPFLTGEIDLVITRTGVYFCIPSAQMIKHLPSFKHRSAREQKSTLDFIQQNRQFKFEQFTHFPAFSLFDARDADPRLVRELAEKSGMAKPDVLEHLTSLCMIEETNHLEKYLIHETWGHVWQSKFTRMKLLYQNLASLQYPIGPDRKVVVGEKIVTFTDLLFLGADGRVRYDDGLAHRMIEELIREHVNAMLAPICAELCADIVEYLFIADHEKSADLLPSSSLFKHNAAKLDFAWVDISYFVKMMKKPIATYLKDARLRETFVARTLDILRLKYTRAYGAAGCNNHLKKAVARNFLRFLKQYRALHNKHLRPNLDLTGKPNNAFFLLFTNLLHVQFTINKIFRDYMGGRYQHLSRYRQVLVIFILKYFECDPRAGFWQLDEALARYGIPLLLELHRVDA